MLTPQEIQEQKFEKAVFGGYDMAQIDQFLDVVLADYSSLYKENAALKTKMRVLVDKIEEYRAVDEDLRKTLYNAQISAKDTVSRAQAEAERILRDARTSASQHVTDLREQTEQEEEKLAAAKRNSAAYAEKIRRAMEQSLRQLDQVLELSQEQSAAQPVQADSTYQPTHIQEPAAAAQSAAEAEPAEPEAPAADTEATTRFDMDLDSIGKASFASDPQSDTARIYGDSPYTPKPRFNFSDLRFGKDFEESDDEK